ncbi:hypothetical protein G6F22_016525 [Rhizopus arrhizus]|nr:hypothetical protein G6F22_016525 [Rhizopus arrhizus]
MSRLAIEHKAINLGQGFPDFDPDPALCALVTRAMAEGHNQYPYMPGVAPLREAIAAKTRELYGHAYDPETESTGTSGATEALMATVLAAVNSGDEVVVIEPCYDSYLPAIRLAGGTAVPVPLRAPTEADPYYRIDWQRVRDAITSKTRLLMLNFPHNPTGAVLEESDLDALEAIVRDTGVLLRGAPPPAGRTRLRDLVLRQDLSPHRLEDRLLLRPPPVECRAAQGAPIHGVHRALAHAVRVGRIHA